MPAARTITDREIDRLAAGYLDGSTAGELAFMRAYEDRRAEFEARAHMVKTVRMAINELQATLKFRKEARTQDAAFHAEIAARRERSKAEGGHTE